MVLLPILSIWISFFTDLPFGLVDTKAEGPISFKYSPWQVLQWLDMINVELLGLAGPLEFPTRI